MKGMKTLSRILLIEDDKDISEMVTEYLTGALYEVTQVYDGESAVGEFRKHPYDLVLHFYDKLTGRENLELHCEYMGYHNGERIDEVLNLVDLYDTDGRAVCNYSLGMKQRLAVARAILTKPEFLILDEPINGLDPEGIKEIRSLIKDLNREYGMTVLVSGHILAEMELIADTVGIIKKGRILKEVPLEVIHEYNKEYIELEVDNLSRTGYLIEERLGIKNYKIVSENKMRVYDLSKRQSTISKILVENGVELESIYRKEGTLEGYFLKLIEEDSYAAAN